MKVATAEIDRGDSASGFGGLIGAPAGSVTVADNTSANVFKCLSAALAMQPERRVILSDEGKEGIAS